MGHNSRETDTVATDHGRRVLVLDDDEDMRNALADVLTHLGVELCVCVGSLAELEARQAEVLSCQIGILDVNLGPGQPSGIDAFGWLQRHGFAGRLVFLTGHACSHPLIVQAGRLPNVNLFQKPINLDTIEQLLEGASSGREQ
jgi:DNA-binding NtrC family response regulator